MADILQNNVMVLDSLVAFPQDVLHLDYTNYENILK